MLTISKCGYNIDYKLFQTKILDFERKLNILDYYFIHVIYICIYTNIFAYMK